MTPGEPNPNQAVESVTTGGTVEKLNLPEEPTPIPMLLWCPFGHRHIDEGEFARKPHHTHACQDEKCGVVWRTAIVPTVGVQHLPGFKNTP